MLQIYPFRNPRKCFRWPPLNCNGNELLDKTWRKLSVQGKRLHQKAGSHFFHSVSVVFPGSLVLWFQQWSTWSQGKSLQICPPCSSTLRQKSVDIRRLIQLCSVIRLVRNPFAGFLSPPWSRADKWREARREEALFFLISCNSSCLLANTCLTQTQAALVLHPENFFLEMKC